MPTIYTIGYQGKPLRLFIGQLRAAGVDAVIDVRLRNTSHLAGYTKKDTPDFLLNEGFCIAYEHHPDLAPTDAMFEEYQQNPNWPVYEAEILGLLRQRHAEELGRAIVARYHAPCLLCAEPTADRCHRRLVAETWAVAIPDLTIAHL